MANAEKKLAKIKERIDQLQTELNNSLQKKGAGKAINVPKYTAEINRLKGEAVRMSASITSP